MYYYVPQALAKQGGSIQALEDEDAAADEGADEGAAHPWRAAASQSRVQLARFADAAAARAGTRLLAGREDYVFARDYEELGQHLVTCRPARHSVKNPGIRVRATCRRQGMLEPTEQFKDIARQREKS